MQTLRHLITVYNPLNVAARLMPMRGRLLMLALAALLTLLLMTLVVMCFQKRWKNIIKLYAVTN